MALARHEFTVVDEHGNIVTDAQVEVRREIAGAPLVAIYSDRDGVTPLANPFSVDPTTAVAAFHVLGGAYRIRAFRTGFERIERYVGIGTASETDAGLIPTSISTGWRFDDATADVDPGSGLFRLNHATPASATAIYLDNENDGGNSVTAWLDALDDSGDTGNRGQLTICDPDQPTEVFHVYNVSGSVVDGTGYRKLTVAHVAGAGALTAGTLYSVSFSARGTDSADDKVAKAGDTMTGTLNVPAFNITGASGAEGGEFTLAKPLSGTSLGGNVVVDINANSLRIFEGATPFRGIKVDLTAQASQSNLMTAQNIASDAEIRASTSGDNLVSAAGINTAAAVVTLTDDTTVAIDWASGINFQVTLTTNRILGNPTNEVAGQWRTVLVKSDGGPDTLTFGAEYGGEVPTIDDVTTTQFYLLMIYCKAAGQFLVTAIDGSDA